MKKYITIAEAMKNQKQARIKKEQEDREQKEIIEKSLKDFPTLDSIFENIEVVARITDYLNNEENDPITFNHEDTVISDPLYDETGRFEINNPITYYGNPFIEAWKHVYRKEV